MVTRKSCIKSEELLGILRRDELLLTRDPSTGEARQTIAAFLYEQYAGRYRNVLRGHGDIAEKQSMKSLCRRLDGEDDELSALSLDDVPDEIIEQELAKTGEEPIDQRAALEQGFEAIKEHVCKHVKKSRWNLRRHLVQRSGWQREPLTRNRKPTAKGLQVLNRIRKAANLAPHCIEGDQYLTEEELNMSIAIAAGIGEAALADFWAYAASERFAYNNRSWRNLREWVGEAETYTGTIIEDIPEKILIRPPLASLRELLFNQLRDKLYREHYRGSDSVDGVLLELEIMTENVMEKAKKEKEALADGGENGKTQEDVNREKDVRLRFIQELTDYFIGVESLIDRRPRRLRESLNGNGDAFPAPHQLIAIMEIMRQKQILIADEVGAGKTAETIGGFEYLRDNEIAEPEKETQSHERRVEEAVTGFDLLRKQGKASKAIIICPNNVVVGVWEERLSKYFREPPPFVVIESGDSPEERGTKWLRAKNEADYVLMNIDMTQSQSVIKDEEFAKELGVPAGNRVSHEFLAQNIGADFLVVDEGQSIRNITGVHQESVFHISQCESIRNGYTVVLTATPIYNTIDDVAAFIRILNAGQDRTKGIPGLPKDIDLTDVKAIKRAIATNHTRLVRHLLFLRMLRRETKDCLPVGVEFEEEEPNRTPFSSPLEREDYDVLVEQPWNDFLTKLKELKRECAHGGDRAKESGVASCTKYRQIKDQILRDIAALREEGRPGPYKLLLFVYAHASYAKGITRDWMEDRGGEGTNDPKKSLAREYIAGQLREDLAKEGIQVFIIDGSNSKQAEKIMEQCRQCPDNAVLIARSDIVGVGDDLSYMDIMRSFSPTTVPGERIQGIGRANRLGRTQPLAFGDNIIEGTIEEGMYLVERCKRRVAEDFLHGAPLSRDEIAMLEESTDNIARTNFLAYESKTPLQKIMHIFNLMFRQGKERVREILSIDNGRYAGELVQLYADYEDVTLPGNNRRAILALMEKHFPTLREQLQGEHIRIADIASGPMALARSLAHDKDIDIFSSDIAKPMIGMGKLLWKKHMGRDIPREQAKVCAMDEIDYEPGSMHMAVHALSLQYTKHTYQEQKDGSGEERIRALCRLNEVLMDGGIAYLALPVGIFHEPGKFPAVCSILQTHFGLEVIAEDSGHMQTVPGPGEPLYESYIFTLRKVGPPNVAGMSEEAWRILRFAHQIPVTIPGKPKPIQRSIEELHPTEGSYSEDFVLGTQRLHYETPEGISLAKKDYHEEVSECEKAKLRIEALLRKHNTRSFRKIPEEELLSFTLEEIDEAGQEARDAYMYALLKKYNGDVYAIPTDELTVQGKLVLKRGKGKGGRDCIYLARLDGKKRRSGRKRYFYESEFKGEDEAEGEVAVNQASEGRK